MRPWGDKSHMAMGDKSHMAMGDKSHMAMGQRGLLAHGDGRVAPSPLLCKGEGQKLGDRVR